MLLERFKFSEHHSTTHEKLYTAKKTGKKEQNQYEVPLGILPSNMPPVDDRRVTG